MTAAKAHTAAATTTGKNIAPRVAALLDVMQISDILSVEGEESFTRPIYAGNAIATVQTSDAKKVVTVRTTAFEKAAAEGGTGTVEAVADKALLRGTGARGLRAIMEELLVPVMYDLPDREDIAAVHITPECVTEGAEPQFSYKDEAKESA